MQRVKKTDKKQKVRRVKDGCLVFAALATGAVLLSGCGKDYKEEPGITKGQEKEEKANREQVSLTVWVA